MSANILGYGVIGSPIKHSFSPFMHQKAFNKLAIPAKYSAFHVSPEELPLFMNHLKSSTSSVPSIQGLSVTLPHKQTIISYLDGLTELAKQVGAVNTLYWEDGKLMGHNTDVEGFLAPLKENTYESALILGAGGAASAVLAGLLKRKGMKRIAISARRSEQAQNLIEFFSPNFIRNTTFSALPNLTILPYTSTVSDFDLVINTIPAAIQANPFSPIEHFDSVKLAYDLVYFQTPFLDVAQKQGVKTQNGTEMFIAQGAAQFHIWTKKTLPLCVQDMVRNRLSATPKGEKNA